MKPYEILKKYTTGEISLVEANVALDEIMAGFYLDINKNLLTEEEVKNGTAGLLDTGTGFFDKVQVIRGELVHPANEVSATATHANSRTGIFLIVFTLLFPLSLTGRPTHLHLFHKRMRADSSEKTFSFL
jgi:hypothetical protein